MGSLLSQTSRSLRPIDCPTSVTGQVLPVVAAVISEDDTVAIPSLTRFLDLLGELVLTPLSLFQILLSCQIEVSRSLAQTVAVFLCFGGFLIVPLADDALSHPATPFLMSHK